MPTGYTADIRKGIDFKTYALRCARAFGATIMQRDDSMGELPKKQDPSDYYPKAILKYRAEIEKIGSMSIKDCEKQAHSEFEKTKKRNAEHAKECRDLKNKYDEMILKVKNWTPPTSEHEGLKEFMMQQINISYSDAEPYLQKEELISGENWKDINLKRAINSLERHKKSNTEEIERTDGRNKWIDDLYNSLK